ncbi:NAD(P)-dependent alcohol dehydrogenase [Spiribacter vilamensis]|uniref:Putative zinc-type alcohol dehydrogenase-like protein n=1 Tax=Spiribacter vilamensis TaxID=531306 RepID=A0A4V2GJ26_9GAMM|nr:NAD(P)-dependent alcohol dehydrogenase [Spiribacter vilamensis]RZU98685.1 putative zinc-type alcohol dehydrogenase-like protein [Spiribacter vilamensis]TVO62289.1 NAD(P)-dependent alcohol dehydrogenase [Spiribacter vilamensis]
MTNTKAYAATAPDSGLAPHGIDRRELRADDVAIEIDYCGVCHTDIHFAHNDWGVTQYPLVPGHEIVGRVTAVGDQVGNYQAGDRVGVGCMVDACRECEACQDGLEQYCLNGMTATYNGQDRHDGSITMGGYSEKVVVSERFVVRIPEKLEMAAAAPLLCAGITTYSPLRHYGVKAGHKVGVIGMGGLGHMGVKFARAMGAEVTIFTRSENKVAEAKNQGAHHVIISTDDQQMADAAETFDFMLDTVPVQHDLNPYLACLKYDGTHILVGLLEPVDPTLNAGNLVLKRRVLAGSLIGGMPETQEVLDFCAEHDVRCDIEMLDINNINDAYEKVQKSQVKYRYVIDMATLKNAA